VGIGNSLLKFWRQRRRWKTERGKRLTGLKESEENENGGQRAGHDRKKKAKDGEETNKEEMRGGSFSLTVHHGPLMYEWCDEN